MTLLLFTLGGLALWGIVASIVVVSRDGYRRQPTRTAQDDWAQSADLVETGPSDLEASQWLPDRTHVARHRVRSAGNPAGVMLLRPW